MQGNPVLRLADGTEIMADGRPRRAVTVQAEKVLNGEQAKAVVQRMRLTLSDLPTDAKQANPLVSIITYSLLGMTAQDIAFAFGTTVERLEEIKNSGVYKQLEELIVKNIYESEREGARAIISKATDKAARTMVDALDGDLAFSAAKDILDRSGISHETKNGMKTGRSLSIRIVDSDDGERSLSMEVDL